MSVLAIYVIVAIGAYALSSRILDAEPYFPGIEENLPALLLAILPASMIALFLARLRRLGMDLRAHRYGARLRARLTAILLAAIAAASLPQGIVLLRLAAVSQSSSASAAARDALSSGQSLALAWHDEELERIAAAAAALPALGERARRDGAAGILAELGRRDPRMAAVEVFRRGRSADFAGREYARLPAAPAPPAPGSAGNALPASSGSGPALLRYAAPWDPDGSGGFCVLSLALPEGLETAAALLGKASRNAQLMVPFSARWTKLLLLLYAALVLPLLLLAAVLAAAAADLVVEPLASLESATRRVAAGDYGVRLIVKPGDETGRLVASFNRMLSEIAR